MTTDRRIGIELVVDDKGTPKLIEFSKQARRSMKGAAGAGRKYGSALELVERRAGACLGPLRLLGPLLAGLGAARLGSDILGTWAAIERGQTVLEGIYHSAARANRELDALLGRDYTRIYGLQTIQNIKVKLETVADEVGNVDAAMRALTGSVAAFGGSREQLTRAAEAIQQMGGKGVISMEELRQQLGEAVPTAAKLMAKGLGMSMRQMVDLISKGGLDAKTGLAAMFKEMEAANAGSLERMSQTWEGKLGQMGNYWTLFLKDVGDSGAFNDLKAEIQSILDRLGQAAKSGELKAWAESAGAAIGNLVQLLGWLARNLDLAAIGAGTLTAAWAANSAKAGLVGESYHYLLKMMSGPGGVIMAVGAAGLAVKALIDYHNAWAVRLNDAADASIRASAAHAKSSRAVKDLRADLARFDNQLEKAAGDQEREKPLVDELAGKYPKLVGEYNSAAQAIQAVADKRAGMLAGMEAEAAAKAAKQALAAESLLAEVKADASNLYQQMLEIINLDGEFYSKGPLMDVGVDDVEARGELNGLIDQYNKLGQAMRGLPAGDTKAGLEAARDAIGAMLRTIAQAGAESETARRRLGDLYQIVVDLTDAARISSEDVRGLAVEFKGLDAAAEKAAAKIEALVKPLTKGEISAAGVLEGLERELAALTGDKWKAQAEAAYADYAKVMAKIPLDQAEANKDSLKLSAGYNAAILTAQQVLNAKLAKIAQERTKAEAAEAEKRLAKEKNIQDKQYKLALDNFKRLLQSEINAQNKRYEAIDRANKRREAANKTLTERLEEIGLNSTQKEILRLNREVEAFKTAEAKKKLIAAYHAARLEEINKASLSKMGQGWRDYNVIVQEGQRRTVEALNDLWNDFFTDIADGGLDGFADMFKKFAGAIMQMWTRMLSQMTTTYLMTGRWLAANPMRVGAVGQGPVAGMAGLGGPGSLFGGGDWLSGLFGGSASGPAADWAGINAEIGGGAGAGAGAGLTGAGMAGGAAGALLGSLLAGAVFEGPNVGAGSSLGAMAGMGLAAAPAFTGPIGMGVGALLGALAGGGLGSLFGGEDESAQSAEDYKKLLEKLKGQRVGMGDWDTLTGYAHHADKKVSMDDLAKARKAFWQGGQLDWWAAFPEQSGHGTAGTQEETYRWLMAELGGGGEGSNPIISRLLDARGYDPQADVDKLAREFGPVLNDLYYTLQDMTENSQFGDIGQQIVENLLKGVEDAGDVGAIEDLLKRFADTASNLTKTFGRQGAGLIYRLFAGDQDPEALTGMMHDLEGILEAFGKVSGTPFGQAIGDALKEAFDKIGDAAGLGDLAKEMRGLADSLSQSYAKMNAGLEAFGLNFGDVLDQFGLNFQDTMGWSIDEWGQFLQDWIDSMDSIQYFLDAVDKGFAKDVGKGMNLKDAAERAFNKLLDMARGWNDMATGDREKWWAAMEKYGGDLEGLKGAFEEYNKIGDILRDYFSGGNAGGWSQDQIEDFLQRYSQLAKDLNLESPQAAIKDAVEQMKQDMEKFMGFIDKLKDLPDNNKKTATQAQRTADAAEKMQALLIGIDRNVGVIAAHRGDGTYQHAGGLVMHAGGILHRALGSGMVTPHGGRLLPDERRIIAQAGEWIIRKDAVKHYGSGLFEALNNMALPAVQTYHSGGYVSPTPLQPPPFRPARAPRADRGGAAPSRSVTVKIDRGAVVVNLSGPVEDPEETGRRLAETVIAEIENRAREGEDLFGADRDGVIS